MAVSAVIRMADARTVGAASSETRGRPQPARSFVTVLLDEFTGPNVAETAFQEVWAGRAQVDKAERSGVSRGRVEKLTNADDES